MRKLLVATAFAVAAFSAYPAAACDWNREARTNDPAIASAATPTVQTTSQAAAAPSQTASVASDTSTRKPADEPAPVVLITDRH